MPREMMFAEAIAVAITEEMQRDANVVYSISVEAPRGAAAFFQDPRHEMREPRPLNSGKTACESRRFPKPPSWVLPSARR